MAPGIVAVFDFDHTLTKRDSAARFFRWLLFRSPARLLLVILLLPALALVAALRSTPKPVVRFAVWVATFGVRAEGICPLVRLHVREILDAGEGIVRRDAKRCITQHLAEGHSVVVATGAYEPLVREILKAEGIKDVNIVASSMRKHLRGMISDQHCHGENKVKMLKARGFDPPWQFAYTDHEADIPLLREAVKRTLVNPKPLSLRIIARALGTSPEVVSWQ